MAFLAELEGWASPRVICLRPCGQACIASRALGRNGPIIEYYDQSTVTTLLFLSVKPKQEPATTNVQNKTKYGTAAKSRRVKTIQLQQENQPQMGTKRKTKRNILYILLSALIEGVSRHPITFAKHRTVIGLTIQFEEYSLDAFQFGW